jgi:hypothetical protein
MDPVPAAIRQLLLTNGPLPLATIIDRLSNAFAFRIQGTAYEHHS